MSDENSQHQTATATAPPPPAPPTTVATATAEPPHRGRGGASIGVVLILIGLALFVSRFLPGISIWMLWPLFIIIPGLVESFTPGPEGWGAERFLGGLVTVVIGLIFLGNTTGNLSWGVWWEVLQLWPVLLISAGLAILGKAVGQSWIRLMGTVVVLLALVYAGAMSFTGSSVRLVGVGGGESYSLTRSLGGADEGSLSLKAGVAEIRMGAASGAARSISIEGSSPFGEPTLDVSSSGGVADVAFKLSDTDDVVAFPGSPSASVNAHLPTAVTWDLLIDSGVASLEADLSRVPVSRLELKTGVSSNSVKLGDVPTRTPEGDVVVESGISSVKLLFPSDAQIRLDSDSGLTAHDISDALVPVARNRWETPGFEAARRSGSPVWIVSAKSGIGSFTLDTY